MWFLGLFAVLAAAPPAAAAPPSLGFTQARKTLAHYYREDYYRVYGCGRKTRWRIVCRDGLLVDADRGTAWCNGHDTVQLRKGRPRIIVGPCSMTVPL